MGKKINDEVRKRNNAVLNFLMEHTNSKNDAQLSKALNRPPPIISRIRHGKLGFSPSLIISIHEITEISIGDLRKMLSGPPANVENAEAV